MLKHISKKLISMMLLVSVSLCFSINIFAESDKKIDKQSKTINYLDKKFNLQKLDKFPSGIVPKKFDSVEDAEAFLDDFLTSTKTLQSLNNRSSADVTASTIAPATTKTTTTTLTGSQSASNWAGALIWVSTNVTYQYSGNLFTNVVSVTSTGNIYGPFLGWIPDNSSSYGNITNNGLNINTHVQGNAELYVIIENIGRVMSLPEAFDNTFSNP